MRTASIVSDPRPSHRLNVVDKSTPVNGESHFGALSAHGFVVSSRNAKVESTDAGFAVTMRDGSLAVVEVLPPIRSTFFIATRCTDMRGVDAITIN